MKLSSSTVTFVGSVPTIAAIDVGSNAIRLAIANANADGVHQIVYAGREPVRLGQDVFTRGAIAGQTVDRAVQTLIDFKQKLAEHGVTHVKAVGTGIGLKDGVLLEITSQLRDQEKHIYREQVVESARRLGKKYFFDERHANTVAKLALQIFDQTKTFHELDPEARLILEVAALLHDIGHYVNVSHHHKHAFYLIQANPLVGLTQLQMDMVANVARYHRKSAPKLQHKPYVDLGPKHRLTIAKLAAMLRLADALDHDHASTVENVDVEYKRPRFLFRLKGKGDMLLEKWALAAKRDLFESVFSSNVVVEDISS